MMKTKRYGGYRHINEKGNIVKVEIEVSTGKYFISGTDVELPYTKVIKKSNMHAGKIIPKNKRKNFKPDKSYDKWWNECNLDGTFAYNGVTDDF